MKHEFIAHDLGGVVSQTAYISGPGIPAKLSGEYVGELNRRSTSPIVKLGRFSDPVKIFQCQQALPCDRISLHRSNRTGLSVSHRLRGLCQSRIESAMSHQAPPEKIFMEFSSVLSIDDTRPTVTVLFRSQTRRLPSKMHPKVTQRGLSAELTPDPVESNQNSRK
jgi:hypothetical protein